MVQPTRRELSSTPPREMPRNAAVVLLALLASVCNIAPSAWGQVNQGQARDRSVPTPRTGGNPQMAGGNPQMAGMVESAMPFLPRRGATRLRKVKVDPSLASEFATKLSIEFRDVPGVTITPDATRGELIVMAPDAIHVQIDTRLNYLSQLPRKTQRNRYSLRHVSTTRMSELLMTMGTGTPAVTRRPGGGQMTINMDAAGWPSTVVSIDPSASMVVVDCPETSTEAWKQWIGIIDAAPSRPGNEVDVVNIQRAGAAPVQKMVRLLKRPDAEIAANPSKGTNTQADSKAKVEATPASDSNPQGNPRWSRWRGGSDGNVGTQNGRRKPIRPAAFRPQQDGSAGDGTARSDDASGNDTSGGDAGEGNQDSMAIGDGDGVLDDVDIEIVPDLNQAIIKGSRRDIERVKQLLKDIEQSAAESRPDVEVVTLDHVNSSALADLLRTVYDDILQARQGQVVVEALDNPNALLLIGRTAGIRSLMDLIQKLDQPADGASRLRVYRLQYASAIDVEEAVRTFFSDQADGDELRPGLGTRVRVLADYRTNSVIVNASPRDLIEVTELINELDVLDVPAEGVLEVFPLRNSTATELAEVINAAIAGEVENEDANVTTPSSTLSILSVGGEGGLIRSGLLAGAVVTADPSSNSLLVRAPASAMPLIAELIQQLDQIPGADSFVKVFTIENGDALQLSVALQDLFGLDVGVGGAPVGGAGAVGAGNLAGLPGATAADSALVPLRFSTDQRTNSIIAIGSEADLEVVESVLLRLDTDGFAQRITEVIWLRHLAAEDVALALQTFIQQRVQTVNTIQQFQQGLGVFDLPDRDLIVVPEPVSNSLLISVAPRLYEDVRRLVDQLDRRRPMVLIKVLLAEVALNDSFELGGELGLQDDLVFSRSIAAAAVNGGVTDIAGATNLDGGGFDFNQAFPNANVNQGGRDITAARAVSTFGLGTSSVADGFGGFVLSAASDSVSLLIRTLQLANRLQILSRPQVMTLDNTEAFVQVGAQVARITDVINNGVAGTQIVTEDIPTGLILRVRPRVGADGLIVMDIDAERSDVDDTEGTPIPAGDGTVVIINNINRTTAQSTVAAYSGQTVVFGGLIQKTRTAISRRVPFLADVPLVGVLFRFDRETEIRSELLVIMTPLLVTGEQDLEYVKQVESSRMSWCLADVVEAHGDVGLSGGYGLWGPAVGGTIYPDVQPTVDTFPTIAPEMDGYGGDAYGPSVIGGQPNPGVGNPYVIPYGSAGQRPGALPPPEMQPTDASAYSYDEMDRVGGVEQPDGREGPGREGVDVGTMDFTPGMNGPGMNGPGMNGPGMNGPGMNGPGMNGTINPGEDIDATGGQFQSRDAYGVDAFARPRGGSTPYRDLRGDGSAATAPPFGNGPRGPAGPQNAPAERVPPGLNSPGLNAPGMNLPGLNLPGASGAGAGDATLPPPNRTPAQRAGTAAEPAGFRITPNNNGTGKPSLWKRLFKPRSAIQNF